MKEEGETGCAIVGMCFPKIALTYFCFLVVLLVLLAASEPPHRERGGRFADEDVPVPFRESSRNINTRDTIGKGAGPSLVKTDVRNGVIVEAVDVMAGGEKVERLFVSCLAGFFVGLGLGKVLEGPA